jgi:hypothetical protein
LRSRMTSSSTILAAARSPPQGQPGQGAGRGRRRGHREGLDLGKQDVSGVVPLGRAVIAPSA